MDLLKRRGASPLRITIESSIASPSGKTLLCPSVLIKKDNKETILISPEIATTIETIVSKFRKSSNISISSDIKTPDLSPINNSKDFSSQNISIQYEVDEGDSFCIKHNSIINLLEKRIYNTTNSPASDADRSRTRSSEDINQSKTSNKSNTSTERTFDEVFEVTSGCLETNVRTKINKETRFFNYLKKHAFNSCIPLFKEHEIDFDVFLTLDKNDLIEIGVEQNLHNKMLKLIHRLNNKF